MKHLPLLIKRCLNHGVVILPYALTSILTQYEKNKIPDAVLGTMTKATLEKYITGLYLSSQEMAGDWTNGHEILKELGFSEIRQESGHRTFVSLVYKEQQNEQ